VCDDQPRAWKNAKDLERVFFPVWETIGKLILGAGLVLGSVVRSLADEGISGVEQTLEAIPTISGQSVFGRMKACGIQIERSNFAKFTPGNVPGHAIRNADGILSVGLMLPPIPGTTAPDADPLRDVVARWYVRNGKAYPQNGWARRIQYQPTPLEWINC